MASARDELPMLSELSELKALVGQIEPPAGMSARVRAAVERRSARRRPRRIWVGLMFIPAAAAAAVVAVEHWRPAREPARRATAEVQSHVRPRGAPFGTPRLDTSQRHSPSVTRLPALGAAPIDAPAASQPTGTPKSARTQQHPASARQHARREVATPPAPVPQDQPPSARPAPSAGPSGSSLLDQQVEAYRRALLLHGTDDSKALGLWREMARRWPDSPLLHEIDLQVIDTLLRLGRRQEARTEAARFLQRHPKSPKCESVRALLK